MSGRALCAGLAAVATLAALLACSRDTPRLRPLPSDGVILAFGDSLTRGTGAEPGEGYPELLARLSGRCVVNAGVPGEVSAEGVARLERVLAEIRPSLVLLCHGGNDLLRRVDRAVTEEHLRSMLRLVREAGAEAVLLGVPAPTVFLDPPDFYEDLAREYGVPYDGEALPRVLGDPALKADPIHPNAEGYRRLAEAVFALLRRAGALEGG